MCYTISRKLVIRMKYSLTEQKLLKKLNIEDFTHMSKEKLIAFASSIHKMDPEVAKAAIAQFPNFKELASECINENMDLIKNLVNKSQAENGKVLEMMENEQQAYLYMLENDDLDFEQKLKVMEYLADIRNTTVQLNRDSKIHDLKLAFLGIAGTLGVVAIASSLLGNTTRIESDSDDDDSI